MGSLFECQSGDIVAIGPKGRFKQVTIFRIRPPAQCSLVAAPAAGTGSSLRMRFSSGTATGVADALK